MQTNDSGCDHDWVAHYEWDPETGKESYTYKCEICGELNTCDHAWEIYGENRNYIEGTDNGDGTHNGKYTVETYGECMLCGVYGWQRDDTVFTVENEAHDWAFEMYEDGHYDCYCGVCEVDSTCEHNFVVVDEYRSADYETIKDNGDGTHSYKYYLEYTYKCSECGCEYWQRDNENLLTEKAEKHSWDGDECWRCGAKNTCKHDNKYEDGSGYANIVVHSSDAKSHTITAYEEIYYECPDCGATFDEVSAKPTLVNATEPHEWTDSGICWVCEYVNPCKHPDVVYDSHYWQPDWDRNDTIISIAATTHTVWAKYCDEGKCPDCGQWVQKYGVTEQRTMEHEYNSAGYCYVCDYTPDCAHKNMVISTDYWSYTAENAKINDKYHSRKLYGEKISVCPDCGYSVSKELGETITVWEEHYYNESGVCYYCGVKNNCSHPKKESYTYDETIGIVDQGNAKGHNASVCKVTYTYCTDCGATVSIKNGKTTTEKQPHTFGAANICRECEYVSTCAHKDRKSEKDTFTYYDILGENKHIKCTYKYTDVTCKSCNAYLSDYSSYNRTYESKAEHKFSDGVCKTCGYDKSGKCKHTFENGACTKCGATCDHSYKKCVCTKCGDVNHKGLGLLDCFCEDCGQTLHDLVDDVCQRCGGKIIDVKSITVTNALNAKGRLEIGFKLKEELKLNIEPADALANISFKSSNKKVAAVDANGVITAKAAGKATITITVDNYTTDIDPIKVNVTVTKAPTSIALPKAAKGGELLYVGETKELKETVKPAGVLYTAEWTSNKPEVATVEDGVIKAVAAGTAKITVKTQNGKKATYNVKVVPVPTGIQVEDAILLGEKQTHTLKASLLPEGAEGKITYTVEGDAITLTGNKIKAVKAGSAQITVSAYGVESKVVPVTVVKAPAKVSFEKTAITVAKSEKTLQLKPIIADDEYAKFTWTTSSKKVATVDANGLVTLKGKGTATITVKTHNGKTAKCKITVMPKAPTGLNLSATEIGLLKGDTAKLTAKFKKNEGSSMLNVKVDNPNVVSYENGVLTGVGTGTATVTFETANNVSASCKVVVSAALKEIVLMDGDQPITYVPLSGKQSIQLGVKRIDEEGKEMLVGSYTFKSSNPKIVSVSKTGKVTVKNPKDIGNAIITVTGYNGVTAELHVFYCPAPTKVQMLSYETYEPVKKTTLTVGETLDLYVDVAPMLKEMDTPADLKISSNKKGVASVAVDPEYGRKITITAAKPGKATITVKTHNGKIAKCVVTVKAAK